MIRRPPRSTHCISSAASDVYKRQLQFLLSLTSLKISNSNYNTITFINSIIFRTFNQNKELEFQHKIIQTLKKNQEQKQINKQKNKFTEVQLSRRRKQTMQTVIKYPLKKYKPTTEITKIKQTEPDYKQNLEPKRSYSNIVLEKLNLTQNIYQVFQQNQQECEISSSYREKRHFQNNQSQNAVNILESPSNVSPCTERMGKRVSPMKNMGSYALTPSYDYLNQQKNRKKYFVNDYELLNNSKQQMEKKINNCNYTNYHKLNNSMSFRVVEPEQAKTPTFKGKKVIFDKKVPNIQDGNLQHLNQRKHVNLQVELANRHGKQRDRSLLTKNVNCEDIVYNQGNGLIQNPFRRVLSTVNCGYDNEFSKIINHSFIEDNKKEYTPQKKKQISTVWQFSKDKADQSRSKSSKRMFNRGQAQSLWNITQTEPKLEMMQQKQSNPRNENENNNVINNAENIIHSIPTINNTQQLQNNQEQLQKSPRKKKIFNNSKNNNSQNVQQVLQLCESVIQNGIKGIIDHNQSRYRCYQLKESQQADSKPFKHYIVKNNSKEFQNLMVQQKNMKDKKENLQQEQRNKSPKKYLPEKILRTTEVYQINKSYDKLPEFLNKSIIPETLNSPSQKKKFRK
eukprot:TRINITY_DN3431_c0_g1_i3.p1 TRINITY_DN3431_c0_g1~~TRINITY_DN3431_c0_g1_i3.p1  ORF type:complete len:623 (-),score=109.14 TRINITY_DN3431_c0_g1_i3:379-2247(-)